MLNTVVSTGESASNRRLASPTWRPQQAWPALRRRGYWYPDFAAAGSEQPQPPPTFPSPGIRPSAYLERKDAGLQGLQQVSEWC